MTGWHLAVLEYFATRPGLFPGQMILDSPLSNVGHDAADQEFRDQQIVNAFYVLLAEIDSQLDRNSCELLFLHPATARVGRRARLTLERRLASLMDRGEKTDENRANAAASRKLTMTVAMGEAAIRVCRPGLTSCELSAEQIVDLFLQRPHEG